MKTIAGRRTIQQTVQVLRFTAKMESGALLWAVASDDDAGDGFDDAW